MNSSIRLLAGAGARRLISERGLNAQDVCAVAAAAGGPKGLALMPIDRFAFGHWLANAPRPRGLFGASIGAWRMAAAAQTDCLAALDRLEHAYLELQRYQARPSPAQVSRVCRDMVRWLMNDDAAGFLNGIAPGNALHLITARQLGSGGPRASFARAALANIAGRDRLAAHLQRVIFSHASHALAAIPPDGFGAHRVDLVAANAQDALLASGSIPLIAEAVDAPDGAPAGRYWDGGLVDYHLHYRYAALDGLVLYPHFVPYLTAGWLDKSLPWRRHGIGAAGHGWLDNVLMVVPSDALLARLPNGKLPDRTDFRGYGLDHDRRLRDWRRAISECGRMAEEFAQFVERPDPGRLQAL